jgi:AcrR family transcriptional regulator
MARPNESRQRRGALLPIVARAFADLGYSRATTAELARRCGVRENILYRLWPSKKAMFLAAIEFVYALSAQIWKDVLAPAPRGAHLPAKSDTRAANAPRSPQGAADPKTTGAERVLVYESAHHGEFGLYRIIFAGLNETDDPDVRRTLRRTYARFQRFISRQIAAHRAQRGQRAGSDADLSAWAVVGLGTVANIGRELGLLNESQRRRLIGEVGRQLLEGTAA